MSRDDIQEQFDFLQDKTDELIDVLKKDFSPVIVAAAFISKGVFIAKTCMNIDDYKINELIVQSVTAGKDAAINALEEYEKTN